MHSRKLLPWYGLCLCTTSILSLLWKIPKKLGMISLQGRCEKHRQNQVFSIRGAYFWKNKPRSPILRDFGEGFYALGSFTGQQYIKMFNFGFTPNQDVFYLLHFKCLLNGTKVIRLIGLAKKNCKLFRQKSICYA